MVSTHSRAADDVQHAAQARFVDAVLVDELAADVYSAW